MANFDPAYKITVFGNEGFYNPGNGEAETYEGLDRSQHPNNPIWPIIDGYKKQNPGITVRQMNAFLAANTTIQASIHAYYKSDFWDDMRLDGVDDQQVANNLFDCNINPCIESAHRVMQEACNRVKPGSLVIDGKIGPATIACVNMLNTISLNTAINNIREANYRERVKRSPNMAPWLSVWLRRLVSYK